MTLEIVPSKIQKTRPSEVEEPARLLSRPRVELPTLAGRKRATQMTLGTRILEEFFMPGGGRAAKTHSLSSQSFTLNWPEVHLKRKRQKDNKPLKRSSWVLRVRISFT